MSNLLGGFFRCLPASASMSRSMTQKSAGGSTQLTSLVSAVLLIAVLLGIGPVLAALPKVVSILS